MKRNNINAIRTCHYPDGSLIYRLCDEYGIYLIDENNLESHGTWDTAMLTGDDSGVVPNDRPEWLGMMLDRVNSVYQRDKNHPAILIWSCGNESYGGKDIYEMSELFRKLDPRYGEPDVYLRGRNQGVPGKGQEQAVHLLRIYPRNGEFLRSYAQIYGFDRHGAVVSGWIYLGLHRSVH